MRQFGKEKCVAKMGSVNGMFDSEERKVLYKEVAGVRRRFDSAEPQLNRQTEFMVTIIECSTCPHCSISGTSMKSRQSSIFQISPLYEFYGEGGHL